MYKTFLQAFLICAILLCRQSDKTILEHISFQWLKACNYNVNSQIVFVPAKKMRRSNVLLDQVTLFLFDLILLADYFDATTAT